MPVTQAGLEGIVAAESNICFIDGDLGILSYQGYNIHTLAEHATFEEVIYLLWHGKLPKQSELDALKAELVRYRPIPKEVIEFLGKVPKGTPMDVLRTGVSMLGLYDPKARDNSIEANVEKAARLMAQTATIVTTSIACEPASRWWRAIRSSVSPPTSSTRSPGRSRTM